MLALVGCSAPYRWSGEWEGFLVPVKDPKDPIEGSANRIFLSVKPSGEATLVYQGLPAYGELQTSGSEATFIGKTILDQPLSRQSQDWQTRYGKAEVKVIDDYRIDISIHGQGAVSPVALKRKPQPSAKP